MALYRIFKKAYQLSLSTSSNQRLWECVGRRMNFDTDTLNADFPSFPFLLQLKSTNAIKYSPGITAVSTANIPPP